MELPGHCDQNQVIQPLGVSQRVFRYNCTPERMAHQVELTRNAERIQSHFKVRQNFIHRITAVGFIGTTMPAQVDGDHPVGFSK